MSARNFSSGCVSGSSTLEADPTPTNRRLPSGEKTRSRVQCPPPAGRSASCSGCQWPSGRRCGTGSARRRRCRRCRRTADSVPADRRQCRKAGSIQWRRPPSAAACRRCDAAKDLDIAAVTFGHEDVAVRSGSNLARLFNVGVYSSTLNPAGACGQAFFGRSTDSGR